MRYSVYYPSKAQGGGQWTEITVDGVENPDEKEGTRDCPGYSANLHRDYLRKLTRRFVVEHYVCLFEGATEEDELPVGAQLEKIFSLFNSGGNPLSAPDLQRRISEESNHHTSMAVGDVIQLGEDMYAVADCGYMPLE